MISGVTAWANRLFEASESGISEAALLFSLILALKLRHQQVMMHLGPTGLNPEQCNLFGTRTYNTDIFFKFTIFTFKYFLPIHIYYFKLFFTYLLLNSLFLFGFL